MPRLCALARWVSTGLLVRHEALAAGGAVVRQETLPQAVDFQLYDLSRHRSRCYSPTNDPSGAMMKSSVKGTMARHPPSSMLTSTRRLRSDLSSHHA